MLTSAKGNIHLKAPMVGDILASSKATRSVAITAMSDPGNQYKNTGGKINSANGLGQGQPLQNMTFVGSGIFTRLWWFGHPNNGNGDDGANNNGGSGSGGNNGGGTGGNNWGDEEFDDDQYQKKPDMGDVATLAFIQHTSRREFFKEHNKRALQVKFIKKV